jgi:hypothetical protein
MSDEANAISSNEDAGNKKSKVRNFSFSIFKSNISLGSKIAQRCLR